MNGFWEKLDKPFFCLAPLADVTDAAFRRVIAEESRIPERNDVVMWTEFVSADGLFKGGFENLSKDLIFTEAERPIVAQFFSPEPELMKKAAELAQELGFDGVDINMGCPAQNVCKQGSGAALIKDPDKAREIIRATKAGAGDLPVSVKTRIGYNKNEIETWLPELLAEEPAVVTLHARTKKEMSKVPAHWDVIKRAVEIRDELKNESYIVGNGDVVDLSEARQKTEETDADGVMLGRAIFGNPWLFANFAHKKCDCKIEHPPQTSPKGGEVKFAPTSACNSANATQSRNRPTEPSKTLSARECVASAQACEVCGGHYISPEHRLTTLTRHTKLFEELLGGYKNFALMKKHFKSYVSGFDGAKELRLELMEAEDAEEVEREVKDFLASKSLTKVSI